MHSLIVKGIATKRIKGKSANMVNGEWVSAKTSPRKYKLLKVHLPEDSAPPSPRASTFRPPEPKTGRDSVVTTNRLVEFSQPPDASSPIDFQAKKKSFRINLEPRAEDAAPKESSFLFPGQRTDGSRLVKQARQVHRSPEISVFAQPSRHSKSVESTANALAELGFSNEVSLNLKDRGITFRDHSQASDFHTERESRPSSPETFEKAVRLLNLNPDLLTQKLNLSGFQEYSHLTDQSDPSNSMSIPFSEYGPDFYNQIASMILADPDLREKTSKLTKDPNDIFRQGAGNTRKIFMELVESGNVKQIFGTILKNILTPKQVKNVPSPHQIVKNYRIKQKTDEEFKASGPVAETKHQSQQQRAIALEKVNQIERINQGLLEAVADSIQGLARNKKLCHDLLKVVGSPDQKSTAVRQQRIPDHLNIMKRNIADMSNAKPTAREARHRQKLDSLHRSFADVQARKKLRQSEFSIGLLERVTEIKEKDRDTRDRIQRELFKRKHHRTLKQICSFVVCVRFVEAVSLFLASSCFGLLRETG